MSKDERKEMIENIAERFTQMDDADKSYIAGYLVGKEEERQKWEQQRKTAVALGLTKTQKTVIQPDNEAIRGMIRSIAHLVKVEEIAD